MAYIGDPIPPYGPQRPWWPYPVPTVPNPSPYRAPDYNYDTTSILRDQVARLQKRITGLEQQVGLLTDELEKLQAQQPKPYKRPKNKPKNKPKKD